MRKTPAPQPTLFALEIPPRKAAPKRAPLLSDKMVPAPKSAGQSPKLPEQKIVRSKAVPVRAVETPSQPVRVVAEKSGAGGHAWRMSGKHAVAYLRNAVLAGELLATEPRHLAKFAMAVYYDRKGKAFAWQVRFDTERWEEVTARLG